MEWIREQLLEAPMIHQRIDRLESILAARLTIRRPLHPIVSHTLARLAPEGSIRELVRETGYRHRTVATLFRRSVGLTPKQYARVLRFRRVLASLSGEDRRSLAEIALDAGYSDQAHFTREFKAFTGVTPLEYRRARPELPYHLGTAARLR